MFFSGSLQSPTVVATPGLTPPPQSQAPLQATWGENLDFSIPDPGEDCQVKLVIRDQDDDEFPLIEKTFDRTTEGAITFTVSGTEARTRLRPGIILFQAIKITNPDSESPGYSFYPAGKLELWEGPASLLVPKEVS